MNSKTKKIIITVSACAMVIIATVAIVLGVYFARTDLPLFAKAREVLAMTFKRTDLGVKKPLKREINQDNPLNLVNFYGDVELDDLWKGIPDNQKPYTIVLIIMGGNLLLANNEKALNNLEKYADDCEARNIPYIIQNINGETHMESRLPIAYLEKRFANHKNFYGLNAAELYNGIQWRGVAESDQTEYLIDCIKLCAKYGAYFVWTDTNRNYENGMIVDYIEKNEAFYDALKGYGEYVCMLNKESYGVPSTYAIMQGLWLAGLIGNWGVASDWWHWQVDNNKSLFNQYNSDIDNEWEQIFSFPENMYVQSMMMAMSRGATCFKAEAPMYSTTLKGQPIAGFQYGISPFFDRIIDGRLQIPNKETVLNETKTVVIGGDQWQDVGYNFKYSNLYPCYGDGLIALVPKNLRLAERDVFLSRGIELVTHLTSYMNAGPPLPDVDPLYSFLSVAGNSWYYINPSENIQYNSTADFVPRVNSASAVGIMAQEHTSAIITEQSSSLNFYVSNYRTDKSGMIKKLNKNNIKGKTWSEILAEYLLLDNNGNPLGVTDTAKRKVEIVIKGSYNGGKPILTFSDMGANARDYTVEEDWNQETQTLTISLQMNGCLEFSVQTDDSGKILTYEPRQTIEDTLKANDNSVETLEAMTQDKIVFKEHYTYYSYLQYNRAFSYARKLVTEKTGSEEEIYNAIDKLNKALNNLTDVSKLIYRINAYFDIDPTKYSTVSYTNASLVIDKALREMLSVKPYSVWRSKNLEYSLGYKKFNKGDFNVKKTRLSEIEKKLTKALKSLEDITY